MKKKRRKARKPNRAGKVGIAAVTVCLVAVMSASIIDANNELAKKRAEQESLQSQLENEQNRTKDLEKQQVYVKSKKYIEDVAREFGYIYKGEILLTPEEK